MNKLGCILLLLLAASCVPKQEPIAYGTDGCDYCKMTIMDHRYGAELVTSKGKVYTFDAAECLIEYLHHNEGMNAAGNLLFVTPYNRPDTLTNAREAIFLVSKNMPSPMGAYLSAFSEPETADSYWQHQGGELYSWDELFADFRSVKREVIAQ